MSDLTKKIIWADDGSRVVMVGEQELVCEKAYWDAMGERSWGRYWTAPGTDCLLDRVLGYLAGWDKGAKKAVVLWSRDSQERIVGGTDGRLHYETRATDSLGDSSWAAILPEADKDDLRQDAILAYVMEAPNVK